MSRWVRPTGAAWVFGATGAGMPAWAGLPQLQAQRRSGRAFSVRAESPVRAEAVRPFPVEVIIAQVADGDRGTEVSELPCSTGERASSVEPVGEIAMAESLVVTRPRRVKDDITGIRFWLEIEEVRTCRGPVDVRGIQRAVRTWPAGVVRTLLVHLESSASRGGRCQRRDRDSYRDSHGERQDQSLYFCLPLSRAALDGGPQDLLNGAAPPEDAALARLRRAPTEPPATPVICGPSPTSHLVNVALLVPIAIPFVCRDA